MRKPVQARIPPTGSTSGAWLASRSDGHRLHAGVDLLGPEGTEVVAPEGGTIVLTYVSNRPRDPRESSPPGWGGYGPKGILLRGDSGAFHNLSHMGSVERERGAVVREGDRLGTVSDLRHLHWEVRCQQGPTGRAAIAEISGNPAAWLEGRWEAYDGRCPTAPVDSLLTPRACRPGWVGPAPRPFPPPRRSVVVQPTLTPQISRPCAGDKAGSDGSR